MTISSRPMVRLFHESKPMGGSRTKSCILRFTSSDPDPLFLPTIQKTKSWADATVPSTANIIPVSESPTVYKLLIKGFGRDGRCRWCSSFRTALSKHFTIEGKCTVDFKTSGREQESRIPNIPTSCAICVHPAREFIEQRILSGEPLRDISEAYPHCEIAFHKFVCMEGKNPRTFYRYL
ncbi:MAG: hypothetical protein MUO26_12525 [Methanotrichaceae archaeon]|nr:hypothetical protein [Methanotrichaceae archaeon]